MDERINIAIDGPAGAGKSTVARSVAEALGYIYIDTGAMYRAVTWSAREAGLDIENDEAVAAHARKLDIRLAPGPEGQIVLLGGEDVTDRIRSRDVNLHVSRVAAIDGVRVRLVEMQRGLAAAKGVVMDGRDIGSHVLPDAELKVYLTASVQERARRRHREAGDSLGITLEVMEREIEERDRKDMGRAVSPLIQADDAVLLDSTGIPADEVVSRIREMALEKLAEAKQDAL
ncbi:(d)CMP kinase [Paenibacillus albicereus]|uniref:Cytidylate kinase n=2 Tax=Paenibacillus albicereus TaxID=2726185 RepID=A0A6H2H4F6_9BACL|nr:(d)CMP kinase [Paenibacillus albicereus]QJC54306.1 (d)CMP kinase [Paenibacillus albicereus]